MKRKCLESCINSTLLMICIQSVLNCPIRLLLQYTLNMTGEVFIDSYAFISPVLEPYGVKQNSSWLQNHFMNVAVIKVHVTARTVAAKSQQKHIIHCCWTPNTKLNILPIIFVSKTLLVDRLRLGHIRPAPFAALPAPILRDGLLASAKLHVVVASGA